MMKKIPSFILMLFFTFCVFAGEESDGKQKLAIMDIEDKSGDFDVKSLYGATEFLKNLLRSSNKFIVVAITPEERTKIMTLKESFTNGYYKNHVKLGEALPADIMLVSKISSIGKKYLITSELITLEQGIKIGGGSVTFETEDSLLPALLSISDQITGEKSSIKLRRDLHLSKSDFYGEYVDSNGIDKGLAAATMIPIGAASFAAGFITLAFGLWGDDESVCKGTYGEEDCKYRFNKTEKKENIEEVRKKLIISGAVFAGVGTALFIPGATYAVWDKYTKGEHAAGFLISFGALAAAGGGTMIGLADGNKSLLGGGIATAAVGAGMLAGGIAMAVLDARARYLKGSRPRNTSFFVVPDKDGFYAQLGFDF